MGHIQLDTFILIVNETGVGWISVSFDKSLSMNDMTPFRHIVDSFRSHFFPILFFFVVLFASRRHCLLIRGHTNTCCAPSEFWLLFDSLNHNLVLRCAVLPNDLLSNLIINCFAENGEQEPYN